MGFFVIKVLRQISAILYIRVFKVETFKSIILIVTFGEEE
jgi:hypothetical protein